MNNEIGTQGGHQPSLHNADNDKKVMFVIGQQHDDGNKRTIKCRIFQLFDFGLGENQTENNTAMGSESGRYRQGKLKIGPGIGQVVVIEQNGPTPTENGGHEKQKA